MKPDFCFKNFKHQEREFNETRNLPARALLWQMRSGKSKSLIDQACHHFRKDTINGVLVFAPNGVHEAWLKEQLVDHHWKSLDYNCMSWNTELSRNPLWRKRFKKYVGSKKPFWFSINSESMWRPDTMRFIRAFIQQRRFLVIFDEVDDFRSPKSKRTKFARAIAPYAELRRTATGTMVMNNPLHAFSMFELLKPGALGFEKYKDFKEFFAVFRKEKIYARGKKGRTRLVEKLIRYKNLDILRKRMAKYSSVVLREDIDDMPDILPVQRRIIPTKEQKRIYAKLLKEFLVDINRKEVSIGENTVRLQKLQQVLSGYLIDEYGDVHQIPGKNPKLIACMREIKEAGDNHVIIWCNFHEEIKRVTRAMRKRGITYLEYHGRIGKKQRELNLKAFMAKEVQVLIGNPKAGGRGRKMSVARKIIWFSQTFDAIIRSQADERGTEVGGKTTEIVDFYIPNSVEAYIMRKVRKKVSIFHEIAGRGMKKLLERSRLK